MPGRDDREFDVILWGATGFVGRLTAEYFAEKYADSQVRWAIAGRSLEKLEALRAGLSRGIPKLEDLPLIVGDCFDEESLHAMAARTRVMCTTVGPYAQYGDALVAACIEEQTHYCDLTGEVHWVRRMVDAHHEEARKKGVRITHCCGFDSIPSDIGTLLVQDHARRTYGAPCDRIKLVVWKLSGGLSGGTLASMSGLMEEMGRDREVRRIVGNPYALNPEGERSGPDKSFQQGVRFDDDIGIWTGPFVMASVNEAIVRRSNAILGYPYGRDFRYQESMRFGKGARGAVSAGGFAVGLGGFAAAMSLGPTRKFLEKFVLPSPGEGPSRESIEKGHFVMRLFGRGTSPGGEPFEVRAEVAADKDPGYGATAIMLGESALSLASDEIDSPLEGGILTPASAMGMTLVKRLRQAGMRLEVSS
ncbi:MAG: saccharopine dehydrogenase family protein [Bradymonadaceae bacterium]